MSLLERVVALREQAVRHLQFDVREDIARRLRERTGELERYVKEIDNARSRLAKLANISPPEPAPSAMPFFRATESYGPVVSAMDPRSGIPGDDGAQKWRLLKQAGKAYVDKLEKLAKDTAGAQRVAILAVMSAADIEGLRNVPGTEIAAATLATLRQELNTADWLNASPIHLEYLLEKAASFKELADGVRAKDIPDAVKDFFQEARSQAGAPYRKLTSEVLGWLQANSQLERLRVVMR